LTGEGRVGGVFKNPLLQLLPPGEEGT